jgi:phosphohistidine phosphatase
MHLAIFRHGRAVDRAIWAGDDRDRPLTEEGRARTQAVAEHLTPLISAQAIWTSPWLRARATADIAARAWGLPVASQALLAGDGPGPAPIAKAIMAADSPNLVLVGHEPDLSTLAGWLGGGVIRLKKAGFIQLSGEPEEEGMVLDLVLSPKALGRVAR